MPRIQRLFCAASFLFLATAPCFAQNCSDLLLHAGEHWSAKQSSDKAESAVSWFCSRSFESENDAKQFATQASFPIEGILVGGSLSGSGSNFKEKQQELCSSSDIRRRVVDGLITNVDTINPIIAGAVATCVSRRGAGLWLSMELTPNPKVFKVHITSQGLAFAAEVVNLALVPANKAHCSPVVKAGSKITAAGLDLVCERRNVATPITVALNFAQVQANWDTTSTIPAEIVWKKPQAAAIPNCNHGGAAFIFPNGEAVANSLEINTVVRSAAKCSIDLVEFLYDCGWPNAGPTWRQIAKATPERSLGPDVGAHARLPLDNLTDGRNNPVAAGALCQIQSVVHYSNGSVVPNFTSFRYLHL